MFARRVKPVRYGFMRSSVTCASWCATPRSPYAHSFVFRVHVPDACAICIFLELRRRRHLNSCSSAATSPAVRHGRYRHKHDRASIHYAVSRRCSACAQYGSCRRSYLSFVRPTGLEPKESKWPSSPRSTRYPLMLRSVADIDTLRGPPNTIALAEACETRVPSAEWHKRGSRLRCTTRRSHCGRVEWSAFFPA